MRAGVSDDCVAYFLLGTLGAGNAACRYLPGASDATGVASAAIEVTKRTWYPRIVPTRLSKIW